MTLVQNIKFHLKIYFSYALQNLKVKMSYPWDFFANMLGTVTYALLNVAFLWVILNKTTAIKGWTFPELVFLYGMGEFCFGLFAILFFHMVTRLSEHYIVEGYFDRLLVRPISPLMQLIMENMDMFDLIILIKGAVLIGWSWAYMPLDFNFINILSVLLAFVVGATVYLGIFLSITSISFWLPDRGGLLMPLFSLSDVSRYPLTIYPPGIRLFFSYVIPFGFAAFYPTVWVLKSGPEALFVLLESSAVAVVMLAIAIIIFRLGVNRYESTGT